MGWFLAILALLGDIVVAVGAFPISLQALALINVVVFVLIVLVGFVPSNMYPWSRP